MDKTLKRNTIVGAFFVLCWLSISVLGGKVIPDYVAKKIGDRIELMCSLGPAEIEARKNSSGLTFLYNNKTEVPRENIAILNETTIIFTIERAEPMKQKFYCMYNRTQGVAIGQVDVGTPPTDVLDFECTSYSYEYFTCSFTPPPNEVAVQYFLNYTVQQQVNVCELRFDLITGPHICNLTIGTGGYRQVHEFYNFILTSENALGAIVQKFEINHYKSVKPLIYYINTERVESDSATLVWRVRWAKLYDNAFEYDIKITSELNKTDWQTLDPKNLNIVYDKTDGYKADIVNLKYAYMWYDVRIRIKVAGARDNLWSDVANCTFKTSSIRVVDPPETDIGSFFIDATDNIHLYWKPLPKYEHNGANIHYIISEVRQNGIPIFISPVEISTMTAKFNTLPSADYEFVIKSENDVGASERSTVIRVPKKRLEKPSRLKNIYNDGIYTLSWKGPYDTEDLVDYTIFWCTSRSTSSRPCEGPISFFHVDKENQAITHETNDQDVHFAISANSANSSSGMIWTTCTAPFDSDFIKMKPSISVQNATTIKIEWKLECIQTSILDGYRLIYCPIGSLYSSNCTEPEKEEIISGEAEKYFLKNLIPYTTYKISMSMFSSTKQGPNSDPQYQTTVEAAPTPPRRLTYYNVTNNSVVLTWEAPQQMNGVLRHYEIVYNNDKIKLNENELTNKTHITFTLNRLGSYRNYKIYVIATTVKDSNASNDISVHTGIGKPDSIEQPTATREDSGMTFSWNPPKVPSGRNDYYEFRADMLKDDTIIKSRVVKLDTRFCKLRSLPCVDDSHRYEFSVRAVNVIYNDEKTVDHYNSHVKREAPDFDKLFDLENSQPTGDVPKTTILKRHSNAEIDLSYDNERLPLHKTNRIRHNRQDKEIFRGLQLAVTEAAAANTHRDGHNFYCDEGNDHEIESRLHTKSNNITRLHGEWSKPSPHYCHLTSNSSRAIMIFGIIFSIAFMCGMMYSGCLKYRKMKSIDIILPLGLTDLDQEPRAKGVDNMYPTGSNESLFKNEEHHLLSGRIDASYFNAIPCKEKSDRINEDDFISEQIREDDNSGNTDSVEMSDMSDSSNTSPVDSPAINLREKAAPIKIVNEPIIINGYVQHQTFQNPIPPPSYDYTQLDAFGKPIITNLQPVGTDIKHKEISQPNGIEENICGYVTHKQLSDFGHRLQ